MEKRPSILIVCRRKNNRVAPFIIDQATALEKSGVVISFFYIEQKGIVGYVKAIGALNKKIQDCHPNIIHAHYGLSGLLANMQRKVPVVTTYHGSDINNSKVLLLSKIAMRLSAYNIFVSKQLAAKAGIKNWYKIIPCGVDVSIFYPIAKEAARRQLGLSQTSKLVLFSSAFDIAVKNYPLAKEAIDQMENVLLIELKGYTREQVNLLMNACDAVLMTSHSEGSPQFIKEALAVGCPIVSVDVGDVKDLISGLEGCFLAKKDTLDMVKKLNIAILSNHNINNIKGSIIDSTSVNNAIKSVYEYILKNK